MYMLYKHTQKHTVSYLPRGNNLPWSIVVWITNIDSFHIRPIEMHCCCSDNLHTHTHQLTQPINPTPQSNSFHLLKRRKTVAQFSWLVSDINLTLSLDLWHFEKMVNSSKREKGHKKRVMQRQGESINIQCRLENDPFTNCKWDFGCI